MGYVVELKAERNERANDDVKNAAFFCNDSGKAKQTRTM